MPIKNNGYSHVKADARQDKKRQAAEARQRDYNAMTLAEKVAYVTARGGSKRELARLMAPPKAKPTTPPPLPVATVAPAEPPKKQQKYKSKLTVYRFNSYLALQFTGL